jgi:hypothetical protein
MTRATRRPSTTCSGAFIVDDPAAAAVPDRVWVINILSLRETPIMAEHELLTINCVLRLPLR